MKKIKKLPISDCPRCTMKMKVDFEYCPYCGEVLGNPAWDSDIDWIITDKIRVWNV